MKRCEYCGRENDDFASLCFECGTRFDSEQDAAAVRNYISNLRSRFPGYSINLMTHSLGAAVGNQAIKLGAQVDNYAMCQGAMSAWAFDGSNTNLIYSYLAAGAGVTPDCDYQWADGAYAIPSKRDLEDYTRLWLPGIKKLYETHTNLSFELGIRNNDTADGPAINLVLAVESDGGTRYLTNTSVADDQISAPSGKCIGRISPHNTIRLNDFFELALYPGTGAEHFIWCGARRGKGELVLQVKDGSNLLAETSAWLDLKDIKEMYERWTVGDDGTKDPTNTAFIAQEDLPAGTSKFQYGASTDPNTPYILHVHGWNMDRWEKDRFGETMFKRLYWQGYQGRFGIFRWPTYSGWPTTEFLNSFDKSEYQAWKSGEGLRNLLVALNAKYPGQVLLTAHSMGTVVAGEALRTNTTVAAIYVAMQGAVPAGAYDMAAPFRAIPNSYFDGTTELYRFYPASSPTRPYFYQVAGAGAYVNFYNPVDWALNWWESDQNVKPADTLGYTFDISTGTFYQYQGKSTQRVLTCPTNTYELFAYSVEGQCYALGAQANVGGAFNTSRQADLDFLFSFGSAHQGHSGQFRSTYMDRAPFWALLATRLGVK